MRELITGKNKERFEKWYREIFFYMANDGCGEPLKISDKPQFFYNLDFKMQTGVLFAYYDSLDNMTIEVNKTPSFNVWYFMIDDSADEYDDNNKFASRPEAQREAFIKADEKMNEKLNK